MSQIRKLLVLGLLLSAVSPTSSRAVAVEDLTPVVGSWGWCTTRANYCIKSVAVTSPKGATTIHNSSAELPSGLSVGILCLATNPCANNNGSQMSASLSWPGRSGWSVSTTVSTGTLTPYTALGSGVNGLTVTRDGDGTNTMVISLTPVTKYSGSTIGTTVDPKSGRKGTSYSDEATSIITDRADAVISMKERGDGTMGPLAGAWGEANASGFSGGVVDRAVMADGTRVSTFIFEAGNSHYYPRSVAYPLVPIEARVRVFLPNSYFASLGYSDPMQFDASMYSVTTADGQQTTPTMTRRADGILIDLGIEHYSSPDPTLRVKVADDASWVPVVHKTSTRRPVDALVVAKVNKSKSKVTFRMTLTKDMKLTVSKKVGRKIVTLKSVKGSAGLNLLTLSHKRGTTYVIRDSSRRSLWTAKP